MSPRLHHVALAVTLAWTLGLLLLGSVVHATESSLACPDWPTCFGTMMPEMTGGVFWEHLHRLVAGGLVLLFGATAWLIWRRQPDRRWLRMAGVAGLALLVVQSVLGGLTVLMRLPDAISSSHLALAFLFLGLATVMTIATARGWGGSARMARPARAGMGRMAGGVATLVLAQSVLGAVVRHTDAGMACPDVPLCLGQVVPPLAQNLVALHFGHRLLGIAVALATLALTAYVLRRKAAAPLPALALGALVTVLAQVTVGFLSVSSSLAVVPVSLHTLLAALLFALTVGLATYGREPEPRRAEDVAGTAASGGATRARVARGLDPHPARSLAIRAADRSHGR